MLRCAGLTLRKSPLSVASVLSSCCFCYHRLQWTCLTAAAPALLTPSCPNPQAQLKAQARNKKPERRGCWLWVNAKTLEGALDPLFLAFSLCVSLAAIAAGIFTIIKSNSFNFTVNSWDDFTQVGRGEILREYPLLLVAYAACRAVVVYGCTLLRVNDV